MHILSSGKFVMKRRSLPQQISGQLTVCVCVLVSQEEKLQCFSVVGGKVEFHGKLFMVKNCNAFHVTMFRLLEAKVGEHSA